jgi:Protein of unknown function (DUF3147).
VAALDWAEQRIGSTRAGWISSFPIVGAPALLLITLLHGAAFGAKAGLNAAVGVLGWAAFICVYRFGGGIAKSRWAGTGKVCASLIAWLGGAVLVHATPVSTALGVLVLAGAIVLGAVYGRITNLSDERAGSALGARVMFALTLVLSTVIASNVGGERVGGLLTTFPIVSSALLIPVTWRGNGKQAVDMSSGMLIAGPALALFMLVVAMLLDRRWPIGAAFGAALGAAVGVHVAMWEFQVWRSRRDSPGSNSNSSDRFPT